jgi:hypothetical protein
MDRCDGRNSVGPDDPAVCLMWLSSCICYELARGGMVSSARDLVLGLRSMRFVSSLISVLRISNFDYTKKPIAPALGIFQPVLTFCLPASLDHSRSK